MTAVWLTGWQCDDDGCDQVFVHPPGVVFAEVLKLADEAGWTWGRGEHHCPRVGGERPVRATAQAELDDPAGQ